MTIDANSTPDEVLEALKTDGMQLKNAAADLKNDSHVVFTAVQQNPKAITFADPGQLKTKRQIENLMYANAAVFEFLPEEWRDNEDIVALAIGDSDLFKFASTRIKTNPSSLLKLLRINASIFPQIPIKLQSNEKFVLKALESFLVRLSLNVLPEKLRGSEKIVLLAIEHSDEDAFDLIDLNLRNSHDFALKVIRERFFDLKN